MHTLAVLVLLYSPAEIPVAPQQSPEMWAALMEVSLALQIVSPAETWAADFASETRYVRHYMRLLADAPPLADADLLPSRECVLDCRRFSEQYAAHLAEQQLGCPRLAARQVQVLADAHALRHFWDRAAVATDSGRSWACRRQALTEMRGVIGAEAWYAGRWPAAAPVWGFHEID